MKKKGLLSSLSGGNKIFLLTCLAAAFAVDFAVMVFLLVGGIQGQFWVFPMLFAVADLAFIVQAVFSNFRFKYTVAEIAIYIAVTLVALAFMLWADVFPGGETYFTNTAAAVWYVLHLALLISALCAYLHAAKFLRGKAGTAVAVLLTVVCFAGAGFYATSLAANGFLGQGPETAVRPLAYDYDEETDGYAVKRVLNGRGTSITIPDEFNGKKVTKIYGEVFANSDITDITFWCDASVVLADIGNYYFNENLAVHIPRDSADALRANFFDNKVFELANAVVPCDLKNDEAYITFAYDEQAYNDAKGNVFPTYIAKKGTAFDLGYFKDIPYARHTDRQSDDDLYWCYNNGGKILSPLKTSAGGSVGTVLNESLKAVNVSFEKVFRVYPVSTYMDYVNNDKKYTFTDHFEYSKTGGAYLGYKLTVAEFADEILEGKEREGFSLRWFYASGDRTMQYQAFESLRHEFEIGLPIDTTGTSPDFITLAPVWEMNAPSFSMTSDCANNAVTYGEKISLMMNVTPAVPDGEMTYFWEKTNANGYTESLYNTEYKHDIVNIYPSEAGEYLCTVRVTAESTSLDAYATGKITIKVDPRVLTLKWTDPSEAVYTGEEKRVSCEIVDGLINGDDDQVKLFFASGENSGEYITYAGKYTFSVGLSVSGEGGRYTLDNSTHSFEILKAPLDVQWSGTTKTYNGSDLYPVLTVSGECENDKGRVSFVRPYYCVDAGEYNLTATLASDSVSSSYYIRSCTSELSGSFTAQSVTTKYIINPKPVDITMTIDGIANNTHVYDGKTHKVTATATGVNGTAIVVETSVSSLKNAGTYNVTAKPQSRNYSVNSGGERTVVINKRTATPYFSSTTFTYNGADQAPNAYIFGVGDDAKSEITVSGSGAAKDAGTYNFVATTPANANYVLTGDCETEYTIKPYAIRVNWTNTKVTYDGKSHLPVASAAGVGNDGNLSFKVESINGAAPVNAGNYACRAVIVDGTNYLAKNYEIEGSYGTTAILIERVTLKVTPDGYTIRVSDSLANIQNKLTFTVTGFVNGEKQTDFDFSSVKCSIKDYNGGSLKAGSYTLVAGTSAGTHDQPFGNNYVLDFGEGILTVLP